MNFIQIKQHRISVDHIIHYRVDILAKESSLSSVQEKKGNVTAVTVVNISFTAGNNIKLTGEMAKMFLDKMEPNFLLEFNGAEGC